MRPDGEPFSRASVGSVRRDPISGSIVTLPDMIVTHSVDEVGPMV